jgi:hypothetical protein
MVLDIEECSLQDLREIVKMLLDRDGLRVIINETPDYRILELAREGR